MFLGSMNLQGITVRRNIQEDCYAQTPARGMFWIRNRRGGPMPRDIVIDELDGEARAHVVSLAPRTEVSIPRSGSFQCAVGYDCPDCGFGLRFHSGLLSVLVYWIVPGNGWCFRDHSQVCLQ